VKICPKSAAYKLGAPFENLIRILMATLKFDGLYDFRTKRDIHNRAIASCSYKSQNVLNFGPQTA